MLESKFTCDSAYKLALRDDPDGRDAWRQIHQDSYGINVGFGQAERVGAESRGWSVGDIDFIMLSAFKVAPTPVVEALEGDVFVKFVKSGSVVIELEDGVHRFGPGSLVIT